MSEQNGDTLAHANRQHFKRRVFLVKNRFQILFALVPLAFFLLFLAASGFYLYKFIRGTLNYYIYQPHSRVENIWSEVAPAIFNVAAVGGGVFLLLLALWVWRRHHVLKTDIALLDRWAAGFDEKEGHDVMKTLRDRELRLLGARLVKAADHFHRWDRGVNEAREEFIAEARRLEHTPDEGFIEELALLSDRWKKLTEELNRVRVDERLS